MLNMIIISSDNQGLFFDKEDEEIVFNFDVSFQYNRCKCGFKKKDFFLKEAFNYKSDENVILNCKVCKV